MKKLSFYSQTKVVFQKVVKQLALAVCGLGKIILGFFSGFYLFLKNFFEIKKNPHKKEFLNKKFLLSICMVLIFGFSLISYFYYQKITFEKENREYKKKIIQNSIEGYKNLYGYYPEKLKDLEKDNFLKPVDSFIKGNEEYFMYKKTGTGYIFVK